MFNLSDEQFPWGELRYTQMVAIRQRLVEQNRTPNTINLTLAAGRGA